MAQFDGNFIQYSKGKVKDETKNLALFFIFHITLYIVLFFFAIFFAWYTVFISTHNYYVVEGPSMMPTLNSQIEPSRMDFSADVSYDAVYVDHWNDASVFDIVVVKKNNKNVIKRYMAAEGDYITIAKGTDENGKQRFFFYRIAAGLNLDNVTLEEAKIPENGENGYQLYSHDEWFSNGRNLDTTYNTYEDSFYAKFLESYGTEDEKFDFEVIDGLIFVKVPTNSIFVMGDNRAHSSDCRQNGFYLKPDLVGKAEIIVYNHNFASRLWEVIKFYFSEVQEFFAR